MAGSVPILNTAFKILLVTNVCFTAVKIHRDSGKLADFHSTEKKKKRKKERKRLGSLTEAQENQTFTVSSHYGHVHVINSGLHSASPKARKGRAGLH